MNHHRMFMFGTALCLLGLGLSDTAAGQTITTSPAGGMNFQVQSGGAQAVQNLSISTSIDPTTIVVTVPGGQTWLKVNGTPSGNVVPFPNTPATLPVQVNTTGLVQGQTVQANILIEVNNLPSSQISYPVSLTVGTPSLLTASPANLTFSAIQGNSFGNPTSIPVTVSSSGQALTYNVTPSTSTGVNWLLVTNTSGIPTNSSSPGFSVSVNASSLSTGTYNGLLTIQSTTTGDSTTIPVTLSVTQGAALNITGTPLNNFVFQAGSGTVPSLTQQLMISTNSGSLNYQITAQAVSGPVLTTNWLAINPQSGGLATTTPQSISLGLTNQVVGLPAGTYVTNLNIAPTAGGTAVSVPVTLVVSNNGIITVNNNNLSFTVPFGSTVTQSQSVQLSSSNGSSVPYQAQTNQSWLSVSPTSGTTSSNSTLTIFVNPSGLNVSTTPYTGTVTVTPNNSDFGLYSVQINVSVTVTSATTTIYAAPDALLFSYETTVSSPAVQSQQVILSSPGTVQFSASAIQMTGSNCPTATWLGVSANQNVTPATLTISVNGAGMTAGFCTGTVIVTYNNGSSNENTSVNIPVTVDIAPTPLLTIAPSSGFGVVTATLCENSCPVISNNRIYIGSTDGSSLAYSAFASTPGSPQPWLSLGNSQGPGQEYIQVVINPTGLPVGVYNGSITINANSNANLPSGTFTLPVVLTVSTNTTVVSSPTSLTFTSPQGATAAPPTQTITLTATGGTTGFTASVQPVTGGSWLQVTPLSGTATGTITASVAPNTLSVGTYTSNIIVKFLNAATSTVTIPVSLTVTAAQTVTVSTNPATSPTALSFSYQLGSTAPASQTLNVTSTGGAVPITITTNNPYLSVSPANGSTGTSGSPLAVTVSIVPSALTTAQTLNGTVTITPSGQTPINIPVTVAVTPAVTPQPASITNSASGTLGPISPGELITIKGTNLGPAAATTFTVGTGGTLNNTLAGVQVLFDSTPGTPIYVSPTQINVIVPYEIAGRATTNVSVIYQNQQSAVIQQSVANQAPGIYTDSSTGVGQASVLNQNGTLNGPSTGLVIGGQNISTTPATVGSVIAVYMTGGGQTGPVSTTGTVTPTGTTLYKISGVTATINGVPATVQFAGAAPGLVTGVMQVNIQVPAGVTGSALPLVITVNNVNSQTGATVAVQ